MGRKKPENEQLVKFDGLTVQEHTFCAEYVANGGNATAAAQKAFPGHLDADGKGHRLLMEAKILEALKYHAISVRQALDSLAPRAVQRMAELMEQDRNPKVAYLAANDLLDRTGHRAPEKSEHSITIRLEAPWRPGGDERVIDVTPAHKSLPQPEGDTLDVVGSPTTDETGEV